MRDREQREPVQGDVEEQRDQKGVLPALSAYAIAILVGLAFPVLGLVPYLGISIYLIVPIGEIRRLRSHRA